MAKLQNPFRFVGTPTKAFEERDAFLQGVRKWENRLDRVAASNVQGVTVDGELLGTNTRMTKDAFADLCRTIGVPVRFITSLAARNESLAIEVMNDAVSAGMLDDSLLLVDTKSNRVDGIVREDRYNPPDVHELMRVASTFSRETQFLGGWINGHRVRLTAKDGPMVDVQTQKPAKVGDLIGLGFELMCDIGTAGNTRVANYVERLSCLNGMTARSSEASVEQTHDQMGINATLLRALVEATVGASDIIAMANRASSHFFDAAGVREVKELIATHAHPAASQDLAKHATQVALVEAQKAGRSAGEICLWDFTNGVTDAAKFASSLDTRRGIEDFGYTVMVTILEK